MDTLLQKIKRQDGRANAERTVTLMTFKYAVQDAANLIECGRSLEALELLKRHRAEIEAAENYLFTPSTTHRTA